MFNRKIKRQVLTRTPQATTAVLQGATPPKHYQSVTPPRLSLLGLLLSAALPAQATEFLELLKLTAGHPSVISARASAQAASADIATAAATNSLKIGAGLSSTGYRNVAGAENTLLAPQIRASKILYDHGRQDENVRGREATFNAYKANIAVTRENLNKQLISLYTTALTDRLIGRILDEEIVVLKELRQRLQAIAQVDSGRASEVNQVNSRLQAILSQREARETSEQQAWAQVRQLVRRNVTLTHELPDLSKNALFPSSLPAAEKQLLTHPELVVASFKRYEAEAAVQAAAKWNRPKWTVEVSLDSPHRAKGGVDLFKAGMVQFSTSMDLFDGGAGRSTEQSERARLRSAEADMDSKSWSLQQELQRLWVTLPLKKRQIQTLAEQVQVAGKMWKSGEVQFFAGRRPLTDLISFASDYYSSLVSYEEMRIQYVATQWQILGALGKLGKLADEQTRLTSPAINGDSVLNPKTRNILLKQHNTTVGVLPKTDLVDNYDTHTVQPFRPMPLTQHVAPTLNRVANAHPRAEKAAKTTLFGRLKKEECRLTNGLYLTHIRRQSAGWTITATLKTRKSEVYRYATPPALMVAKNDLG